MEAFNHIKLIEFHYILEGFKTLFKYEIEKDADSTMYKTAELIYHEIFNSCVRIVVREETKVKLIHLWREVLVGKHCLDVNIFNEVHLDVNSSLDDYISNKFLEEKYLSEWFKKREPGHTATAAAVAFPHSISANYSTSSASGASVNIANGLCPPPPSSSSSSSLSVPAVNGSSSTTSPLVPPLKSIGYNNKSINNIDNNKPTTNGASCYALSSTTKPGPPRFQSMLSLDSGFQSIGSKNSVVNMERPPSKQDSITNNNKVKKEQKSKSKIDKVKDKFASLPKELFDKHCSSGGDAFLLRHINKTITPAMIFNDEQTKSSQRNHSSSQSLRSIKLSNNQDENVVHGHLPNEPESGPVIQSLLDKLNAVKITSSRI